MPEPSLIDQIVADAVARGYHPRSDSQSGAQSKRIVRDLLDGCQILAKRARTGELVVRYTHHQRVAHEDWKIDIALGTKAGKPIARDDDDIEIGPPAIIQIAIELKSIWTEHGKAQKNRFRDFSAFHGHAHRYDAKTVAAAFLAVNSSNKFYSPLNRKRDQADGGPVTRHGGVRGNGKEAARKSVELFRSIHLRNGEHDVPGLEALAVAVIEHDNFQMMPPELLAKVGPAQTSRPVYGPPAPQPGDPLHYETFLQRICAQYRSRFSD